MYTGQVAGRQQRLLLKKEESSRKFALSAHPSSSSSQTLNLDIPDDDNNNSDSEMDEKVATRNRVISDVGSRGPSNSLIDQIDRITDGRELKEIWLSFQKQEIKGDLLIQSVFSVILFSLIYPYHCYSYCYCQLLT